jgi:hypothetical protein
VSIPLFQQLKDGVKVYDNYFIYKEDAVSKVSTAHLLQEFPGMLCNIDCMQL